MRSSLTLFAILLTVVFAACKQETKVEETATMTETVATFAPATTDGTIVETQTTVTTTTAAPVTTTTVTTVTTTQATAKPVTKPAAQPVTPPPATTTTQAPAEPAPEPVVQKPATPAPAPAPATKPATRTPSTKAPKTHTVNHDGALHPANTENPTQRCGACHGKDLKGGKVAPSCYSCHETAKW